MLKKILIIFCIILAPLAAIADYQNNNVGYPPGFYDDIDPNSIEDDENDEFPGEKSNYSEENSYEQSFHEFSGEDIIISTPEQKGTKNYSQIYNNLEMADFSYQHNIDPDQYYDMKDTAWSVYPLLRLNSPIYFKSITIEPGYYLLTPREHNGKWFMLFKQNGSVVHIIPVYDRDYTPETFYEEHIPQPKLTTAQKVHMGFLDFLGKFDSTKRKEPVKSFLEVNDLDNYFISIIIYYGNHKYSTIFRTIRL